MNVDVRVLFTDGERAAKLGDDATARACFLEAARSALDVQLWRSALRCYRHALELDLFDRDVVSRVLQVPARVISGRGWDAYAKALDARPAHAHFGCRSASVVIGDHGAHVECKGVGTLLEIMMSASDLVESRPVPALAWMPSAMALVILRRAMWPVPRDRERSEPMTLRVIHDARERVRLEEHGDWEPLLGGGV